MDIFECYQKFIENNGTVGYLEDEGVLANGLLSFSKMHFFSSKPSFHIQIRREMSIEDKVETVIHELLHLSDRYKLISRGHQVFLDALHKKLEEEALCIYKNNPEIVMKIRAKIEALDKFQERSNLEYKIIENIAFLHSLSDQECRIITIGAPLNDPLYAKLSKINEMYGHLRSYHIHEIKMKIGDLESRTMDEKTYNELLGLSLNDLDKLFVKEAFPQDDSGIGFPF